MGVYQNNVLLSYIWEYSMFQEIKIKFVDDERTNFKVLTRKPKTKKRRIVKKWFKRYGALVADTKGCSIVGYSSDEESGGMKIYAIAHPLAKKNLEKMNEMNDGNQPRFTWD